MSAYLLALVFLAAPPKVLDDRLQLELILEHPDIATPTGIAVTDDGLVLVVENNTHFRPKDYPRAPHDRILALKDTDGDGKPDTTNVFFEGTKNTMNLAVHFNGGIYVATRSEIFRLTDKDRDGKADQSFVDREKLVQLETKGDYPHNGLSGFAFDILGNVYFGFGENLGADYELIGTDGKTLKGGGEGGNIYTCTAEGKYLERVATGFWNPFHVGFDRAGNLFTVDNDPDSRPPCRLLHVVPGGDYGFKFRNGRKGVHPFTSWNGELPGTLPMVAGTGEAPCAVLAYDSDQLPEEYRGELLVTSWGDHRLERYRLRPRGVSFQAEMKPLIVGDENFRPVGLALAPDGSLYLSDWVDKSYNLHGKGRVWKLSAKNPPQLVRPKEAKEAILSQHRPFREAAARRMTDQELYDAVMTSDNADARSTAALTLGGRLLERSKEDEDFDAPPPDYSLAPLADRVARTKPKVLTEGFRLLSEPLTPIGEKPKKPTIEFPPVAPNALTDLVDAFSQPNVDPNDPFVAYRDSEFLPTPTPPPGLNKVTLPLDIVLNAIYHANRNRIQAYDERTRRAFFEDFPIEAESAPHIAIRKLRGAADEAPELLSAALKTRNAQVQAFAIVKIGEGRLAKFRPELEAFLSRATNRRSFELALAALDMLDLKPGEKVNETAGTEYVLKLLQEAKSTPEILRLCLRMIPAKHPKLTDDLLAKLVAHDDAGVRVEAIRTWRERGGAAADEKFVVIAKDAAKSDAERAEAVVGMNAEIQRELLTSLTTQTGAVKMEAERGLRMPSESPKLAAADWLKQLEGPADPVAGERLFFHPKFAICFRCHEHEGRGAAIGPDLTAIGGTFTREKLLQSLLEPSREIGPRYTPQVIELDDGRIVTGLYTGEEVDGTLLLADTAGKMQRVHPRNIVDRKPAEKSIMPKGLLNTLTPQEARDLFAFLLKPKAGVNQP